MKILHLIKFLFNMEKPKTIEKLINSNSPDSWDKCSSCQDDTNIEDLNLVTGRCGKCSRLSDKSKLTTRVSKELLESFKVRKINYKHWNN